MHWLSVCHWDRDTHINRSACYTLFMALFWQNPRFCLLSDFTPGDMCMLAWQKLTKFQHFYLFTKNAKVILFKLISFPEQGVEGLAHPTIVGGQSWYSKSGNLQKRSLTEALLVILLSSDIQVKSESNIICLRDAFVENIATGETSPAITPLHFFGFSYFSRVATGFWKIIDCHFL